MESWSYGPGAVLPGARPGLWLPCRRHAATFAVAAAPLFAAALIGYAAGSTVWAVAPLALAVTPLLLAAVLWWACRRWEGRLRELASEPSPLLRWTLTQDVWERYLERLDRGRRWIGPGIVGVALFGGLIFAWALVSDGERIAGSLALTWAVPVAAAAAIGLWIRLLIAWNRRATRAERRRRGGLLLLGAGGFYLTGEYRPLEGMGQTLTGAAFEERDGPRLVLRWHVRAGGASRHQEVTVPVPPGRETEAREAVRALTGGRLRPAGG